MKNATINHTKAQRLFVVGLVVGLFLPFSAIYAQSSSIQYGVQYGIQYGQSPQYWRNPDNGAVYLLPGRDLTNAYPQSIASGLSISCAPTTLNAAVGQTITWLSSVTGGSGSYLYTWNGTESLSGNTSTLPKTYATRGEKFATLTVTSGTRQIMVSCGSVIVGPATPEFAVPGFGASCYAVPERIAPGESVTWLAIVSGTTASTTYAWDGTDGLTGDRPLVSKTYTTRGTKAAMLTMTNGALRIVAPCTNAVTVGVKAPTTPQAPVAPFAPKPIALELQGLCAPSSAKATLDDEVTWHAVAIGGTGTYRFTWDGDDELLSEGATTSKRYETAGIKKTFAGITSGDKALTIACSPIEITKAGNGLLAGAFFSWLNGPVGFILAAILAIIFGIFIAFRKRSKEEAEEEERDHVR